MRKSKYAEDSKRWAFREYLLAKIKKTTALGYMSALNTNSFVNEIVRTKYNTSDLFEISDKSILSEIYNDVLLDKRNRQGHSRYTAALAFYITFITN